MMAEHKRFYMRSDGNGGFNMSSGTMAFLGLLLSAIVALVSFTAANATTQNKVEMLSERAVDIEDRMRMVEESTVQTRQDLVSIHTDITEMKSDIKEILKNTRG